MVKGITGWIKSLNPLPERRHVVQGNDALPRPIEPHAQAKRSRSFAGALSSTRKALKSRSISIAAPRPKGNPPKLSEPPSQKNQPQRKTDYGFPDVETAYAKKKQTLAELREIGSEFDDDPEAAIQELLDVTSRPDHELLPMLGSTPPVAPSEDEVALMKELDRLVPDEDDEEIHLADRTDYSIGEQKRTSDEEILASFFTGQHHV
jgi:hypothetical protein